MIELRENMKELAEIANREELDNPGVTPGGQAKLTTDGVRRVLDAIDILVKERES